MIFYTITARNGETLGATTSAKEARKTARSNGELNVVTRMEIPVTAESIRLLLSGYGGYATDSKEVFVS